MARRKEDDAKKHLQNVLNQKQIQYDTVLRSLPKKSLIAALLGIAVLLLFLVPWAEIYNTDIPGVEVGTNGFSFWVAAVTRNFTGTGAVYKDLAVPFYYYAQVWCERIALATLVAGIALIVAVVAQLLTLLKKAYGAAIVSALGFLVAAVGLGAAFWVASTMHNSDILPIYCSGNPGCSIHTYIYIPALVALVAGVNKMIILFPYRKARAELEKSRAEAAKA